MIKKLSFALALILVLASCSRDGQNPEETAAPEKAATADFSIDLSKADDYSAEGAAAIVFGENVSFEGAGVGVSGSNVTVSEAGTYKFSGKGEGSITVDANENDDIYILLEGLELSNPNGPAIVINEADNVYIVASDNTANILSDGSSYEVKAGDSTADGVVFSKCDLTVSGTGKLSVTGNYKHGVVSKDDLVIGAVQLDVNSKSTAISGKDCVKLSGASVVLNAQTNGIVSDNTEDESRGYIYIENSSVIVNAGKDGIQAETDLAVKGGTFDVTAGGGSSSGLTSSSESYKGLKAGRDIYIEGGTFNVNSKDDCIHSNNDINISDGKLTLTSGDDGVHGDNKLVISGGEIAVEKSYEGLEATYITVSGGNHNVTASDDGINAAGGNDGSAMGERPGKGGFSEGTGEIVISGGYMLIDAEGDGIDSNGSFALSGGEVYVSGPQNSGNGAFDYGSEATVSGGNLVALGASGMAQGFTSAENQGAMLVNFNTQSGGRFSVEDEDGNEIISFKCSKMYSSAVVTSADIQKGKTYTVLCDGVAVATVEMTDNIYGSSAMGPGSGMMPGGGGGHGGPGGHRPVAPGGMYR